MKYLRIVIPFVLAVTLSTTMMLPLALADSGAPPANLTDVTEADLVVDTSPANVGTGATQVGVGGVVTYTDRTAFTTNFPGLTFESFGDATCTGITGFQAPLTAATNNACFAPGQIPAGISFADDPLNDAGGGTVNGLAFVPTGSIGAINDAVIANTFTETFEISLNPRVNAVGLDLASFSAASTLRIRVFGPTSDVLLHETTYPSVGPAGAFSA